MKPGENTRALISDLFNDGADHVTVLMRHSAREFAPDKHDLLNPLTDEGRELAKSLGAGLPKSTVIRGYSSPAERCVETADLIMAGHEAKGGAITRNRVVEALGVFYVLDQMKMFMAMRERGGMVPMINDWLAGAVADDILMPSHVAATILGRLIDERLQDNPEKAQLDLLVSHDFTLFLIKSMLLAQRPDDYPEVNFLDGIAFFRRDGRTFIQSHHAEPIPLTLHDL